MFSMSGRDREHIKRPFAPQISLERFPWDTMRCIFSISVFHRLGLKAQSHMLHLENSNGAALQPRQLNELFYSDGKYWKENVAAQKKLRKCKLGCLDTDGFPFFIS